MISQQALQLLQHHQSKYTALTELITTISLQYKEKMWHQISDNLISYVKNSAFDQTENQDLVLLYNEMVKPLHSKLKPLKYAIITVSVSRQFSDIEAAIVFLEEARTRMAGKVDAQFLCRVSQAEKRLNLGQHHDCLQILNEVKEQTEPMADVDPKVYASLADVYATYYRRKDDQENFYKSGLQFLAYTTDDDLNQEEKLQWSTKLGMAVLLGKKIFNITELLDKQILKSLIQSDFEWLHDLLQTLGRGQIHQFTSAIQRHNQIIGRFPNIVKELQYLEQKVRIIAFLEYVFALGKDDRNISFADIARVCSIEVGDVEFLVMKAMSLELVKGQIDESAEKVQIEWIMPRYLNKEHLTVLINRMKDWEQKMENVILLVEGQAGELLAQ